MGFAESSRQKDELEAFLVDLGIPASEITFQAATYSALERSLYNDTGKFIGYEPYYRLTQDFEIRSNDVSSVEKASRKISDVLDKGIRINMYSPRYYYTKLADLKHEMIKKATEDAKDSALRLSLRSLVNLEHYAMLEWVSFRLLGNIPMKTTPGEDPLTQQIKRRRHRLLSNLTYESN